MALAVTLFFVSVLVFVVIRILPGDAAMIILGTEGSPEAVARLRAAMGLDRPFAVQYLEWIGRARGAISVGPSSTTCRWRASSCPG